MIVSAPFLPSVFTFHHLTKGLVTAGRIGDAGDRAFELFNELAERCLVYNGVVHMSIGNLMRVEIFLGLIILTGPQKEVL
jgi:hypothetical protein